MSVTQPTALRWEHNSVSPFLSKEEALWRWGEKDKDAEGKETTTRGVNRWEGRRPENTGTFHPGRGAQGVLKCSSFSPLESSGIPLLSIVHVYSE